MIAENAVVVQDESGWLHFAAPRRVLRAWTPREVRPALRTLAHAVEEEGLHAAGFLGYEAAAGLDAALTVNAAAPRLPLLWFGLYDLPERWQQLPHPASTYRLGQWQPDQTLPAYRAAIKAIKDAISRGETYQVNYTFALRTAWQGDPWALFCDLAQAQRGRYAAYINLGEQAICCVSPELFFRLEHGHIEARPMKGTARRGLSVAEDQQQRAALAASTKDRAENVMIVDMIRNDLGRVAEFGSVQVPALFTTERYPTLLQMTSTVTAHTTAPLDELLATLFPCASITGAPKARTMQWISRLEAAPRGVYTGTIGYAAPEGGARFNVAIRTVVVDQAAGEASYGVGSGIVWDSEADAEYAECLLKAQVLHERLPHFDLLETMRWSRAAGVVRQQQHVARLLASADYFGFAVEARQVQHLLNQLDAAALPDPARLRLLLAGDGTLRLDVEPLTLPAAAAPHLRLALAAAPINSRELFLYHKTTQRAVYEQARAAHPDYDEVLLWNERGELTEATTANVVLALEDRWVTPPVSSGLLPGVLRGELLAAGRIHEQVITVEQVRQARALYLINSLRGWRAGKVVFR
ncbi:MAG: aminodeoxychorismate synthase component I [Caldilineales bacterium]